MKKIKYLIALLLLSLVLIFGISYATKNQIKTFSNDDFTINYDNSWKLKKTDTGINLIHKKTNSNLNIQVKTLDSIYLDTSLSIIIDEIISNIESQNSEYILINKESTPSTEYDSYSYLYEYNDKQVLVNIYKKNKKLVLIYYEAESIYFDIILDSVDNILDSIEIKANEKILNSTKWVKDFFSKIVFF